MLALYISAVLGNPWPPVVPHVRDLRGSIVNVLLSAAQKEYRWKHPALKVVTVDPEEVLSQQLDSALSWDGEEEDRAVGDQSQSEHLSKEPIRDSLTPIDKNTRSGTQGKGSTPV